MPRYILFDAVGTLITPQPHVAEVYEAVARTYGSRLSRSQIASRFSAALQRIFPRDLSFDLATNEALEQARWQQVVADVLHDLPDALSAFAPRKHVLSRSESRQSAFDELWQHFAQPEHWHLFDDVEPALSELARRGYQLGIASNFDRRLRSIIAGHQPLHACRHVFVSTEVGFAKPSPSFYAIVQKQLGCAADKIVMVGDDPACDVLGPQRANWQAYEISRNEPRGMALSRLSDLLDVL